MDPSMDIPILEYSSRVIYRSTAIGETCYWYLELARARSSRLVYQFSLLTTINSNLRGSE